MLLHGPAVEPMSRNGDPTRCCPFAVRFSNRQAASSLARRCAVDNGSPVAFAISVTEWTCPSRNVIRINAALPMTVRLDAVGSSAIVVILLSRPGIGALRHGAAPPARGGCAGHVDALPAWAVGARVAGQGADQFRQHPIRRRVGRVDS